MLKTASLLLGSSGSSADMSQQRTPIQEEPPAMIRESTLYINQDSVNADADDDLPCSAMQTFITWSQGRQSIEDVQGVDWITGSRTSRTSIGSQDEVPIRVSRSFGLVSSGTNFKRPTNVQGHVGNYFLDAFAHKKQTDYLKVKDMEVFLNMIASDMSDQYSKNAREMSKMKQTMTGEIVSVTDHLVTVEAENQRRWDRLDKDFRSYTDECIKELKDSISATMKSMKQELQEDSQRMHDELTESGAKDICALRSHMDAAESMLRVELHNQSEEFDGRLNEQRDELQNSLSSASQQLQQQITTLSGSHDEFKGHMTKALKVHTDQLDTLLDQHDETSSGFGQRLEQIQGNITKIVADCENIRVVSRGLTMDSVNALRHLHETWLNSIEDKIEALNTTVSETASIPTRKVEWLVHNVSKSGSCRTWLSPKFQVAGASNLQLELKLLDEDGEDDSDCALTLIGEASELTLSCKLYIGEMSAQSHMAFDQHNQRYTRRFTIFSGETAPEDNPLRIGVEVLEAIRTISACRAQVRTTAAGNQAVEVGGRHSGSQSNWWALAGDGDGAAGKRLNFEGDGAAGRQPRPEAQDVADPLLAHQYINHQMLDLVRDQVNQMNSRMTKRVEWKLENASQLRRYFAEGESLCSSTFMAAGLEGLQLVFYPSGYGGARGGYCSLFLYVPRGTTLRCLLVAGKQRREARISYVEQPGFFGRTNFCRFENAVDAADDTVLLALEIEEARQSTSKSLSHMGSTTTVSANQVNDDSTSLSKTSRADTKSPHREPSPSKGAVDSVLKLQKVPGKLALEDVQQLPSIWTSVPVGNIGEVLEGFHNFSDMRPRTPRKEKSVRRPVPGTSPGNAQGKAQFSETRSPSRGASRNDLVTLQKYKAYVA